MKAKFDVAVDLRKIKNFWNTSVLNLVQKIKTTLIPKGFAHGFIVLSESATISYKVDDYYHPQHDFEYLGVMNHLKLIDS